MPPLKDGAELCFVHSDKTSAARSEARARGNATKWGRPAPPTSEPETSAPPSHPAPVFELGVERRSDIAMAFLRVARAVGAGTLDTRRARVLVESLRGAELAFAAGADDQPLLPAGTREATPDEVRFIATHDGRCPPGVLPVDRPFLVHDGPVWTPPADEPDADADPDASAAN